MGENTKIEWAHHSYNLWWGCQEVSPGCDHCYARELAQRLHPTQTLWGEGSQRLSILQSEGKQKYLNSPYKWNRIAENSGTRHRVFVQSMGDVFDNYRRDALDEEREFLWTMIRKTPCLDWLLLTKRIGNAAGMLPPDLSRMNNVWLGVTVVNQIEADRDIPKLLATPARVRFLSCEPMLAGIDLTGFIWGRQQPCRECPRDVDCDCGGMPTLQLPDAPAIHWVIAGGESGPKARPSQPSWMRSLRDQCAAAGVPFHFKQWGEWAPYDRGRIDSTILEARGSTDTPMQRFGKAFAGRELDGVTHDGFPVIP